jgi:hypothetical protein
MDSLVPYETVRWSKLLESRLVSSWGDLVRLFVTDRPVDVFVEHTFVKER